MSKRTTKVILIVIPIVGIIAMILIARWALSNPSPTSESLITMDIEIGVATFVGLFEVTFLLYSAISGIKDVINESTRRIVEAMERINSENTRKVIENSSENTRKIVENSNENTRRIIEAIIGV